MLRSRLASLLPLLLLPMLCVGAVSFAQMPPVPDRISGPIDVREVAPLHGNVHPLASPQYDQGPVEPAFQLSYITMTLQPSPAQQAALNQLLADQRNPSSPRFHKWLTPEQYGARFGASANDLAQIRNWLRSQGFAIADVARGRNWIAFSGTAAQVQQALHTEIHRYQVDGQLHFANASEPSVPQALQGMVIGFRGLSDFGPKAMAHLSPKPQSMNLPRAVPEYTIAGFHFLAPGDLATIYNIAPLYSSGIDGSGMKLVIVGQSDVTVTDIQQFRAGLGLPAINFSQILVGSDPGHTADEGEADLDLEWSGAVARNAAIIYDFAASANGGVFAAAQDAINNNRAPVISMSFGGCEPLNAGSPISQFETLLAQANSQGITFIAASGDSGAAGCDGNVAAATQGLAVNYPASSPEVTGVGGSTFNEGAGNFWTTTNSSTGGSALSYIPEVGWNDTGLVGRLTATGGGKSSCATLNGSQCVPFPKPSWQSGPGVPADSVRDVPDITFAASPNHDGYIFCSLASCAGGIPNAIQNNSIVGGTSASTPVFAGIVTLLNQYLVLQHFLTKPGLGNINPTLYKIASGSAGSTTFHDITTGTNIVPCASGSPNCPTSGTMQFGYSAGPGYDLVTGLGSVNADALITGWSTNGGKPTTTTLVVAPSQVNVGQSVTFTATVTGTGGTPTGTVNFSSGATQLGAATLSAGTAVLTTSSIGQGTYSVTANYAGDATFGSSISSTQPLTVIGTATTTTLALSGSTINAGSSVTLTATVSGAGGTPTGTVTFLDGATQLGTGTLAAGIATLATSSLAAGTHSVTAAYGGDHTFMASTSSPQALTVIDFTITVNPTSLTVTRGTPATAAFTLTAVPSSATLPAITFTCSGLPTESSCSFSPASVTPSASGAQTQLTISTTAKSGALRDPMGRGAPLVYAMLLPGFGVVLMRTRRKSIARSLRLIAISLLLMISVLWWTSCGGSSHSNPGSMPVGLNNVTITASGTGFSHTVALPVTLQ